MSRRHVPAVLAAAAILLAVPASAGATAHYVATTGTGGLTKVTCPAAQPCSLAHAFSGTVPLLPGDIVTMGPGTYNLGGSGITVPAGVTLRATNGQQPPSITGSPGATVTAAGAGATLSRLRVANTANNGAAVQLTTGAVMLGSTAWGAGANGIGVLATGAGGPILHNVTAVGTGTGIASATAGPALTGTNVIAEGANDLAATGGAPVFTLTNSNFDSPPAVTVVGAGNQAAEPILANLGGGDFHEVAGSPTINAGIVDAAAGAVDLDGDARLLGPAPDIGADEFLPLNLPAATTGSPLDLAPTSATLTGSVNPNGLPTTYKFDYGPGLAYGNSTPDQSAGSGTGSTPVSAPLTGLTPGSIVHYRVVATNAEGTIPGLDRLLIVPADPTNPLGGGTGGGGVIGSPQGAGPQILGLDIPINPPVNTPATLTVTADDPKRPVNAIAVSFDEGHSFFAESACRLRPRSRIFQGLGGTTFEIPHTFSEPGVHQVEIKLSSGGCGKAKHTTTQVVTVDVGGASARAGRIVAVAARSCRGANAVPHKKKRLRRVKKAVRCLLNQQRRANGLGGLRFNRKLTRAAKMHTRWMLKRRSFAHQVSGEPSLGDRFKRVHYRGGGGENLGLGAGRPYATPAGMVEAWMASPLHRANILEAHFHTIGIAVATKKPAPAPPRPGSTYTTEFGTTRR